jgi:hypothetical protein
MPRLTYANVVATLALFIALGGASYAALKVPKASVGSKQLKDDGVKTRDIAPDAVGADQLKEGSVGPTELQGNAVGPDNLAPDSVNSSKISDASITRADVAASDFAPRLFAHVSANGVLGDSAGVTSASRSATGKYTVSFNRDLKGCVATASVGFGYRGGDGASESTVRDPVLTASMNPANQGSDVAVEIRRVDFNPGIGATYEPTAEALTSPVDDSFNLIVAC